MNDQLKASAIRGGVAKVCSQFGAMALRLVSLMVLARLLHPSDFGLVGMVTAVLGALYLFRDFGLSTATIQRSTVTEDQMSTLFWVNLLVGSGLLLVCAAAAPFIAEFYREPRLVWVTIAVGSGFLFTSAGVQHSALMQRQMRFTALAIIETVALACSTASAVGLAIVGFGYRSLVVMTVTTPLFSTVGVWIASRWLPGKPRRNVGLASIIRFGGTVTVNGMVVYVAYNIEKVLMGRFWGAESLGIYGRAYQLATIPNDTLNSGVAGVAFSGLSRVRAEPDRLKSYFLKGYSLLLGLTAPIAVTCGVFSTDIVLILLGPQWTASADILRLLAPTVFVLACVNPMYWLMVALGKIERSAKMAFVLAPLVICAYLVGFYFGPRGVAFAYSTAMLIWLVPSVAWAVHGTPVMFSEVWKTIARPTAASGLAAIAALLSSPLYVWVSQPIVRLAIGGGILGVSYAILLLFAMGQRHMYIGLIRNLRRQASPNSHVPAV